MRTTVRNAAAWAGMAGGGVVAGGVASFAVMMALAPVLLFATFVYSPAIALVAAVGVAIGSSLRPCGAPQWAQRRKLAFWLGALSIMTFICIHTTVDYYLYR